MSSKPSGSTKSQRAAASRERLAALEAEHKATRRKQLGLGFGITVIVVVVALIVARVAIGTTKATAAPVTKGGSAYSQVASVPVSVINAVGVGSGVTPPTTLAGATAITKDGKPEVAYVGAEYCPYCAAERWAVVQALSRFGTFSNLGETRSSSTDVYPSTATFDFDGATYSSPYLSFAGYEVEDGAEQPLQTPSADVEALFTKYSGGGFPFADLGGTSTTGVSFSPALLKGLSQDQIAADLTNPNSSVTKAIIGSANAITKQLCTLTHGTPAAVCSAPGVTAAASVSAA